ncbi:hypothetical protein M8818_000637 [Zalaria obscura]|uniref:Uncharacterized protein n=1 Tax=Zalaria obscura TaxID=2024903 RepID=A0ACC3SQQ1_9PEZI
MQPLRKVCTQPRLFQQACRLASTRRALLRRKQAPLPYRPQAQATQPPWTQHQQSQANQKGEKKEEDEEWLRWYEKDVESGEVRRVPGNPEEAEQEELRARIKALEAELAAYGSKHGEVSESALLEGLEPKDKAKLRKALQKKKEQDAALTSGLEVNLELPPLAVPTLKRLNAAVRDAALEPDNVERRKALWRWYNRAKHNIPALPRMIPEKAWKVLWQTQTAKADSNVDRELKVMELLEDMMSVNIPLNSSQKLARMEALVAQGKAQEAREIWESENDITSGHDADMLASGVWLHIELGELEKGLEILQQYLRLHPNKDPRVILHLLAANARIGNDRMAFALYLQLRSKLQGQLTMEDYDAVSMIFLEQDKKDLALVVFRDMMLQGNEAVRQKTLSAEKEGDLYRAIFHRIDALESYTVDASEVDKISLASLSAMPIEWQNKYFYGKWIKKLLGMGQVEAAAKVVELMYERNVAPDARHLNGLIGAYFRTAGPDMEKQGEELAWTMIQKRLDFAWRRRAAKRGEPQPSVDDTENQLDIPKIAPAFILRPIPMATIETFNVLLLHYLDKGEWLYMKHLEKLLRPAELPMGSFFMNNLLQMEMQKQGGKGYLSAWAKFTKYARKITPDMESYNILWTCQLGNQDKILKLPGQDGFPSPRQLFSVMTTWHSSLSGRLNKQAGEDFSIEIIAGALVDASVQYGVSCSSIYHQT